MRNLLWHVIALVALYLLWQVWQDARAERLARRVDVQVDAEGRDDWPAFVDDLEYLGGES